MFAQKSLVPRQIRAFRLDPNTHMLTRSSKKKSNSSQQGFLAVDLSLAKNVKVLRGQHTPEFKRFERTKKYAEMTPYSISITYGQLTATRAFRAFSLHFNLLQFRLLYCSFYFKQKFCRRSSHLVWPWSTTVATSTKCKACLSKEMQ